MLVFTTEYYERDYCSNIDTKHVDELILKYKALDQEIYNLLHI